MKQYKYGVVGSFALGKNVYGGQSIKTRNFTDALENKVGKDKVLRIDTRSWKKNPLDLISKLFYTHNNCEEIIILLAHRGLRIIPRLLILLRGPQNTKLHYVVVGGWLPEFLATRKSLIRCLKKFDGLYVETNYLKQALINMGFSNVFVLPNFKKIYVLDQSELVYVHKEPYKLCTFSRVLKEKGIEDAINAVRNVNERLGRTVYILDIYGKIDSNYEDRFREISFAFPKYIRYMGAVDGDKSTEVIKDYFALLFPTHYQTEGYPGTLLDAFSAGVPVISSNCRSSKEIIGEDKGFLFDAKNVEALTNLLLQLHMNPNEVLCKKKFCLDYAASMNPEYLINYFVNKSGN